MAAVSIPPSPYTIGTMTNRRIPLSSVPNAANSPVRAVAAAASKRSRPLDFAREITYGHPPPAKKHIIEVKESQPRTPPPRRQLPAKEGAIFNRGPNGAQLTAFDKKLLAVKDNPAPTKPLKQERVAEESLESVRQWQRHYRKAFPNFVFYFESIPDESRKQISRQIAHFGAREEKFFSKDITHIVTTRSLPTESAVNNSDSQVESSNSTASLENHQPRTINPSLLDKTLDHTTNINDNPFKSKFTFESSNGRKLGILDPQGNESRRNQTAKTDILRRAKEMGIKIWQLEKVNRILHVMSDNGDGDPQVQRYYCSRSGYLNAALAAERSRRADLSQMMKNEQVNGPADREALVTTSELIHFKGPYIYVRDMNEKTKPVLVREYPRVQRREDGEWPQFRSASSGKCPFLEDHGHGRREPEREKAMLEERMAKAKAVVTAPGPRTRAASAIESARMDPPAVTSRKRPLAETEHNANATVLPVPRSSPSSRTRVDGLVDALTARPNDTCPLFHERREPMASGMQASNITSAIRSQMISSTAAAPGAKAGTSREMHGLQRKVLERNTGSIPNPKGTLQRDADLATASRQPRTGPPARVAKQRAQERMGHPRLTHIEEDPTLSEDEEAERKAAYVSNRSLKAEKGERREPKPGYCENCREKFEDFDEHTIGRKHRKFAITNENWRDLDALLMELVRPLRGAGCR